MQNEELRHVQADLEASRERYFDLYNMAPVGYITVNDKGIIVESNLRAASLFRVMHSNLDGCSFSQSIAVGDRDVYYLARRRLLNKSASQVCELRLQRSDGAIFWGRLEMSLSRPGAAHASRIVIIDISERKLAEQRFDAFMEHTPALASIVDEQGRYVYVNPAMERHTGRKVDTWTGKTFSDVWPLDFAKWLKQQHGRVLTNGQTISETETLPAGAQERVNQVLRFPFSGPNGQKLVGSVSIDVTERRRLENANVRLAAEKDAAEEATRAKSQFLSVISHQIRTPLNGVIGMAGLLLHTDLTTEQLSYTRMVSDSADLLLELVNDVLDISKIEAGKLELNAAPFNLEVLVEDALGLMSFKAHEKSLELAVRYPAGMPRHFIGDAARLRQILMNFLSNAVKFTHAGHVLVEVDASESIAGVSTVQMQIKDTGIGISKANIGRLYTRFGQGDSTIAGRYGGTGLGLSIAKQIVELMGGHVGIDSVEGNGSTFYCRIPLHVQPLETGSDPLEEVRLTGVSVLVAGAPRIASLVVAEWCARWGMKVEQCDLSKLAVTLGNAADKGQLFPIVIVDGDIKALKRAVMDVGTSWNSTAPKLVLISSDLGEMTRDLVAHTLLSTPVRRQVLWDELCVLIPGALVRSALVAKPGPSDQPNSFGPFKVLVTDDNLINQKVAKALLTKMGCQVETADDGPTAVRKVREQDYDLVFMDCVMPEMDGFAATAAIRSLAGKCANIPIVALTASATNEDRIHCLAAGMNDFLTKPIRAEQLAQCLTKWLTKV